VLTGILFCVLAGCAPDAWRPDSPYDAFLDQIQRKCGDERIGSKSISGDFLQEGDAYFLDVTSRYYHRKSPSRTTSMHCPELTAPGLTSLACAAC
jgi:hypothetical protein